MIEFNIEKTNSSVDIMNLDNRNHIIDISIYINEKYHLIIYKNCGIGVLFEYIPSHLNENHGIKVILK